MNNDTKKNPLEELDLKGNQQSSSDGSRDGGNASGDDPLKALEGELKARDEERQKIASDVSAFSAKLKETEGELQKKDELIKALAGKVKTLEGNFDQFKNSSSVGGADGADGAGGRDAFKDSLQSMDVKNGGLFREVLQ